MNRYDLVMFDMDGTLMDSKSFHYEVFYRFLNERVMPVTREQVERGLGTTVREIFDSVGVKEERMESLFQELNVFCSSAGVAELARKIPAAKGIREMLEGLKAKGIRRALVTNSMETVTRQMLAAHGLSDCFEMISGADFYSLDKVERCSKVKKTLGAERILYVGDAENDMELADSQGYDACFARLPFGWCKDAERLQQKWRPVIVIEQLEKLLNYV